MSDLCMAGVGEATTLAAPPADQCLLDASFTRPRPAQAPHNGMMTYSSNDLRKVMSPGETQRWLEAGKTLGYVKQDGKTDALGGYPVGKAKAEEANRQLDDRQAPPWQPIAYIGQDSALTSSQLWSVADFFRGVFSVTTGRPVGRYGGGTLFRFLDAEFGADVWALNWLAAATSWGGYAAAHLVQQAGAPWYPIAGVPTDDNAILRPFARWGADELDTFTAAERTLLAGARSDLTTTTRLLG